MDILYAVLRNGYRFYDFENNGPSWAISPLKNLIILGQYDKTSNHNYIVLRRDVHRAKNKTTWKVDALENRKLANIIDKNHYEMLMTGMNVWPIMANKLVEGH